MILAPPPSIWNRPAGDRVHAGLGYSTIMPDFDFETYSEAGYVWDAAAEKWRCLPGATQGKKGLPVVGSQVYAEHPSTEVLSVYYDLKDGRGRRRWLPSDPMPPIDLLEHVTRGGLLAAWNSGFEYRIWNFVCRRRYGWPALPLHQLRCDAAKARAFALPGKLEKAGQVLDLVYKKDPAGDALLKKFSMPHDLTKKRRAPRITVRDEPEEALRLYAYNERDIVTEAEAAARIPDLEGDELEYWLMDQEINMRGVQVDREGVHNCITIVNQALEQYNRELHALTGGTVARASELAKLQGWLGAQGVHMDSLDAEHIEAALAEDDARKRWIEEGKTGSAPMRADCRRAIEIRAQIGSAAVKKVFSMANMMSAAGRLHDLFTFYGAHTGRTTGNDAQPTNLPKSGPDVCECASCGKFYGAQKVAGRFKHSTCPWCRRPELPARKVHEWGWRAAIDALAVIATRDLATVEWYFGEGMPTVSGCLRALFVSAPGYDLIASDYSAIEAVVLAMIAGVQWRIDVFRTHGKIYEASAAMMAKLSIEEVLAHKQIHGTHHPLRDKGKRAELACGYGGWVGAWIAFGADKYMTEDEMKTATLDWRAASPEIPEFWGGQWRRVDRSWRKENYGVEGAFLEAILNPGVEQQYRGFKFLVRADVLYLTLLSGRSMKYHRPRLVQMEKYGRAQYEISYEGWNTNPKNGPPGWIRKSTYGGRLTENIVQATARDIQWNGMLNLKRAGYPVVLHVYDEDATEVPEGFGTIEEVEAIMGRMPPWAHDWPIRAAGGWRGKRYRKD